MSNAHFELLPTLALELAVCVEGYGAAARLLAMDRSNLAQRASVANALASIQELARPVSAVWCEWANFAAAHAGFSLVDLMEPGTVAWELKLLELEASAEALKRRAFEWAVVEQQQHPVPLEVAQAFVDWEAARRVWFELRHSAQMAAVGKGGLAAAPPEVIEVQKTWETKCAALLDVAVRALKT